MSPLHQQIKTAKTHLYLVGCLFGGLVFVYMYCVFFSVTHVVVREDIDNQIADIRFEISQLEREYISAQHKLNIYVAIVPDFITNPETIFIERSNEVVAVVPKVSAP